MSETMNVFLKHEGRRDVLHVEASDGALLADVLALLTLPLLEGEVLYHIEDSEEPVTAQHSIHGKGSSVFVHRGRCRKVEVTVRYAGRHLRASFAPGTTLGKVKPWAERDFGIDKIDAAELSLQLAGTQDRPEESTHLGSLTSAPTCAVVFDLVPTDRVNGAS
jgi:hypothetical protein